MQENLTNTCNYVQEELVSRCHTQHNCIGSSSGLFCPPLWRNCCPRLPDKRDLLPFSVAAVLQGSGISRASSGSWGRYNAWRSRAPDTCTASVRAQTNQKVNRALPSERGGCATHCFQMCALVFGSVAGVAEGLVAAGVLAHVGLLPSVAPQVDFQVF